MFLKASSFGAAVGLVLTVCAPNANAAQADSVSRVLDQLQRVQQFSGVSISPDGRWITWTKRTAEVNRNQEIYVRDRTSGSAKPRRVTAGNGTNAFDEDQVSWSPDSSRFCFLSNARGTQRQIFIATVSDAAQPRQLTNVNGYVTDARWSPDGKQLGFLYAENGGGGGPLQAAAAQLGVIGAAFHNQRLAVIDSSGGPTRQTSPSELNIYEWDWSPTGKQAAVIAAPGPADNNWWIAQLYALDLETSSMKVLYHPPQELQIAVPRWSPDGKQVAFLGGLMSDEGFNGGDVFLAPAQGGSEPRNLTAGRKSSPSGFFWQSNNRLIFSETAEGGGAIGQLDVDTGRTETLWKGSEALHWDGNYPNLALARDGRTSIAIRNGWDRAPEVWSGGIGEWQQVTHDNADQKPRWGKAENITWTNEGSRVQGWLLYPEGFDAQKKYPMIVEIHGGPAGMRSSAWPSSHFDLSVMAGLGYFVFFPNPRGSYGGGEAFTKANVRDFGGGDLRDILAGVDAVIAKVPVDSNRIGVTGWSYGGYMTMWTVTQTKRFRAAVAGAGIANWQSYYGQNLIDQWMIPYFGASVYDNPAVYAKSSPITFIKQAKTPTLIVVGERDAECPAPQSFEFWHALKTLGVPTQLVVYEGEGHSFHAEKDRADVLRRAVEWFDHYLR